MQIVNPLEKNTEVKEMSDIVNESKGNGGYQGCNSNRPPCHDIGMKYGIFIGVFPEP